MPNPNGMPNVKQPVKAVDPTTNYYGEQKMNGTASPDMKTAVDDSWGNMHGNLLSTGDHEDTQGESNKIDRMKAMARRMQQAY